MHVDVMTTPQPLRQIGDLAQRTQAAHFSGMLFTETGRTAYLNAAVAAQAALRPTPPTQHIPAMAAQATMA